MYEMAKCFAEMFGHSDLPTSSVYGIIYRGKMLNRQLSVRHKTVVTVIVCPITIKANVVFEMSN